MKKKFVYEGYCQGTEIDNFKIDWNKPDIDIAEIPNLHRKRYNKKFWMDGQSGRKVRITIEEL